MMHLHAYGADQKIAPRQYSWTRLIQYGLALLTAILVLAPLLPIVLQSFLSGPLYEGLTAFTLRNYSAIFSAQDFYKITINTASVAAGATLISLFIGIPAAVLMARADLPGKSIFYNILVSPMLISSLVLALGWFVIYGQVGYITVLLKSALGFAPWNLYSVGGICLVAGVVQAPLVFLYCLAAASQADASLENAARTCGAGPLRTLFDVTVPLLRPAILYSVIITLTNSLELLSVPLILGGPAQIDVLATLLYTKGISPQPDFGFVSAAAVILLAIIILLLILQRRMLANVSRFVTVRGKVSREQMLRLGWLKWPIFILLMLYGLFCIVLPMTMLVLRGSVVFLNPSIPVWEVLTSENFMSLYSDEVVRRALLNTILVSGIGAGVGTIFVALVTLVIHRSDFRFPRVLEYLALSPRAVPGIVVGMGFLYAMMLVPPLGWVRNSIAILIIAYVMRYIPVAYGTLAPASMQISTDLDRAARISGATWWKVTCNIILPLLRTSLMASYVLLFVTFFREYTVAVFLMAPGSEVVGSALLSEWQNGSMGVVAALGSVQVIMTLVFVFLANKLFGIRYVS